MDGRAVLGPGRVCFGLLLRTLLCGFLGRIGVNLAGGLVLGEVEFFFNLTLASGQLLVTLLPLEVRADFGLQLLRPFVGVSDVKFQRKIPAITVVIMKVKCACALNAANLS